MLDKIRKALTRKLGPAPAWAWLVILAGGAYWWRHRTQTAQAATGTAAGVAPAATDFSGGALDTSGGGAGGAGTQTPDLPFLDTTGTAPATWDPQQLAAAIAADLAAGQNTMTPTDATAATDTQPGGGQAGGSASRGSQSAPFEAAGGYQDVLSAILQPGLGGPKVKPGSYGGLLWGGQTFRTQAKFMSWLSAHGGALGNIAINHPAAYTLFLTLPRGKVSPAPALRTKSKTTQKAQKPAGTRSKSVRSVPVRSHAEQQPAAATRTPVASASRVRPAARTRVAGVNLRREHSLPTSARGAARAAPKQQQPVRLIASASPGGRNLQAAPTHVAPQPAAPSAPPTTVARQPVGRVAQARQNAARIERIGS